MRQPFDFAEDRLVARLVALRWRLLAAAASGVLCLAAFPGYDQFYLGWICLLPLLWAIDDASLSLREAAVIGWLAGLSLQVGTTGWMLALLRDWAHMPLWQALLTYLGVALVQSVAMAAWGVGVRVLRRRYQVPLVFSAPTLLVLAEWLNPAPFPSFLASSQHQQTVVIQSLDVWGPLGLGFIMALTSSVIYECVAWLVSHRRPAPILPGAIALVLLVADLVYGIAAIHDIDDTVDHADRSIRLGLVQANVQKTDDTAEALRRHQEQSVEVIRQGAQVVVWPEASYRPVLADDITNVGSRVLGPVDRPLIFGGRRSERADGRRRLYTSAFLADPQGDIVGTYDKAYLLPFAEYVPLGGLFPWLYELSPATQPHDEGHTLRTFEMDGVRFGVLIRQEDTLPAYVRRVMYQQPDVLVELTDDAWLGPGRAPLIHLGLARLRAVEQRRFLVRAANTGVSAIVDPAGRVVARTPTFARANLVHAVAPLAITSFYAQAGDWPGWLAVIALLVWIRRDLGRAASTLVAHCRRCRS